MDDQLKQSIQFDIEQLELELKKIENEIQYKEGELKFMSSKVKGVGAGAGAMAFGLAGLTGLATRNPSLARQAFSLGALKGSEFGYDKAEKALQSLETDIALLKRRRDNIFNRIKSAKDKFGK